jgi:predicted amino acid racemase
LLKDVLERKWTSISRLKKQVMELERNNKQLKEINEQNQIDMQNMEKEFKENGHITKK